MFIAIARVGNNRHERVFTLCEIVADDFTRALYQLHGMLKKEGVEAQIVFQHLEWENLIFSILEVGAGQDFKDSLVTALAFAEEKREEYSSFFNMDP